MVLLTLVTEIHSSQAYAFIIIQSARHIWENLHVLLLYFY